MAEAEANDPISLLFLSPKWQYDTYGVASVVRSLANDLWLTDPDGLKIQMTCAVLQEDGKINEADVADAAKHNVKLRGVKLPRGVKKVPTTEEINSTISTYYKHLVVAQNFDFIIGHIPYLAYGALNLQDLCRDIGKPPNVVLNAHALPRTKDNDIDENSLVEWLVEAKIILSVGDAVKSEIDMYIEGLKENERPVHNAYIPGCPGELLTVLQEKRTSLVKGPQNITVITTERKDLNVGGLNYQLAVASSTLASENVHRFCGIQAKVQFLVLATNPEEKNIWEESFKEIREKQPTEDQRMTFQFHPIGDINKLKSLMKRTTVMLLPLKVESSLFGVEALMAAYSGVPILVSSNSGLAFLMESLEEREAIVYRTTGGLRKDAATWSERIIQKIRDPEQAQIFAESLRGTFLLDTSIAASRIEFIKIIAATSNHQLKIELDTEGTVLSESLAAAKKFGVKCEERNEPSKFILAYFTKLLLQREKLDLGVLDSYIPRDVKEAWKEFLSCLEQTKRKLVAITEGSLNFTLFCPTTESHEQLQDGIWRRLLTEKLKNLILVIGVSSTHLKITEPEMDSFQVQQTHRSTLPVFSRLRLQDEESSGYGTERFDSLDQMSIIHPASRVADWLKRVEPAGASSVASIAESTRGSHWSLELRLETGLFYPQLPRGAAMVFSVSESGNIGISFYKTNPDENILLVLDPSTPTGPVILSLGAKRIYENPIFVKIAGGEYLAVPCFTDSSIHLWNTVQRTSRVVYQHGRKEMRLCTVDDGTVAYGECHPTDGAQNVYLLNTSTEQWSLRATLKLRTGLEFIFDMTHIQLTDGASCLVLCSAKNGTVVAIEMLSGNVRWRCGVKQRGARFAPISVCADRERFVYVCDFGQSAIYMLSPEDGTVISTVLTAQQHGIASPCCLRTPNDYLYITHLNNDDEEKWQISKFVKNSFKNTNFELNRL